MLNIVLPIAGRGSRFVEVGYSVPKPLIPIHGIPMVEAVIHNIRPTAEHRFIFLALAEHLESSDLRSVLERASPGCVILSVDVVTEGAACTVLLARRFIDTADSLMIANCDQWVDLQIDDYLTEIDRAQADGLIMTMWADDPKWSFVGFDNNKQVTRVVEKEVISNEATVGIYNFRRGSDFVAAADGMITQNLRVNNEFYVAPVYNQMIAAGAHLAIFNVGREFDGMYGLGTPADLEQFLSLSISRRAATI
jgi:dTDP-glucose pyrophosphorylase